MARRCALFEARRPPVVRRLSIYAPVRIGLWNLAKPKKHRARASIRGALPKETLAVTNPSTRSRQISRRDLFDRIWSKPMTTNAAELGTSTWVLSGLAKRLGLPRPRNGHWMKRDVGRTPPTPAYPADSDLDAKLYALAPRHVLQPLVFLDKADTPAADPTDAPAASVDGSQPPTGETASITIALELAPHKKVAKTRGAIVKSRSTDRVAIGGRGKFRLLVTPSSGDRACAILDRLLAAGDAKGWSLEDTEQGYAIVAEGEATGLMIEEKLDRVPHVMTSAEIKEKAQYDHKCELAARGIGWRPWGPPKVPEYDYIPNGELILKLDQDYAAGGTRRTFSDGKRQRLEDGIPSIIDALVRRAAAVKASREERAERERQWAEQERRRKDNERQVRVEGYRIAFLQRQVERKREIDGLSDLIAEWENMEDPDPKFAELLEFATLYRTWLENRIAPAAIAKRIADLKLMDDDVYIYDANRLD